MDCLFKVHENDDCDILLKIVRFLYYKGIDIRPDVVIERNMPNYITVLPSAKINNELYRGLNSIINYFESTYNLQNIQQKALYFDSLNPYYRITDYSTHKNIINVDL